MKIIITESQYNKILNENINEQYENTKYIIKILAIGYIKNKIIEPRILWGEVFGVDTYCRDGQQ